MRSCRTKHSALLHRRGAYLNAIGNALVWSIPQHRVYLWTLPMYHCNGWCFPDLDIAVLVHDAPIAGVEPAAGEYFLRRLGVLEIPLHHDVAAHEDLADGLAVARHWLQLKQSLSNPEKKKGAAIMPPPCALENGRSVS